MKYLRWFWAIVAILALGWIVAGFAASGNALEGTLATSGNATSQTAFEVGAAVGVGLSVTFFLCTGFPIFLLASLLYWRNGVGLKRDKQHKEQLEAISDG